MNYHFCFRILNLFYEFKLNLIIIKKKLIIEMTNILKL